MTILGIDLGTTNSCVAVLQGGDTQVLPNAEGERTTPSVVAFGRAGERLVGAPAKRQAIVNPENTIFSVKRFIGRLYRSEAIQGQLGRFPFRVVDSPKGDVRFEVHGQRHSAEELSAMILSKIRSEAEALLGETISQAVITVPAYFDDRQRTATKDAGRIAGLEVLRIINEPTAAALAYGLHRRDERIVAVFDLGGGTFDVSILEQRGGEFRVLATAGDPLLGGDDFDQVVMDYLVREFEKHHGFPLPAEATVLQRLKNAAESAKKELSFAEATQITIPFITAGPTGPIHLEMELLRAEFENLVAHLVARTVEPCRIALADAGLKPADVDGVVLVGGQTRSPIVQRKVEEVFGKPPFKGVNPEEAVAIGAAVTAGIQSGALPDMSLRDVTPLTLGIETTGGAMNRIIPRNTPVPVTARKVFTTTEDDQIIIRVHVLQGEREMASDNRTLGLFDLVGVRPGPRGVPKIEITFQIDEEGIVHVTARDQDTGRSHTLRITDAGGLSDAEIERMVDDAERHRGQDDEARELLALKNQSLNLVYSAQRLLDDPSATLTPDFRRRLVESVNGLNDSLHAVTDRSVLDRRAEAVLEVLRSIEYAA